MKILTASLAVLLSTTTLGLAAGFEILKPHRAVYDVTLESAEDRSGIKGMTGRIVYEVKGNECEGIAIRYRFVTTINTGRDNFTTDQQTSTYESPDGKEFSFETKSFVNDQADQKISGSATISDKEIEVNLKGEKPRNLKLGEGIFTTTHLVTILKDARKGERFVVHDVFDGSGDADKLLNSASVIGTARVVEEPLKGEDPKTLASLKSKQAWPVSMSYFDKKLDNTGEALPIYEASFLLYEDGITRQLMMRYPDYELRASLTELEYYSAKACKLDN